MIGTVLADAVLILTVGVLTFVVNEISDTLSQYYNRGSDQKKLSRKFFFSLSIGLFLVASAHILSKFKLSLPYLISPLTAAT